MADHHEYCTGGFSPDDIVISGISGRFPKCDTIEELKEALLTKKQLLEQNNDRYEKGAYDLPFSSIGTVQNIDKFDAQFFGLSPAQVNSMEPVQRIFLEVAYEAILDAGYEPKSELAGEEIGVYAAVTGNDSSTVMLQSDGAKGFTTHTAAGYIKCMIANRSSYFFDFHGPSYTMDTACSSSMVAFHNAVTDLREGRVEAALIQSGELCLSPVMSSCYLRAGIHSPTAEIHPYDQRANGFVRTEGIAAFLIQKASKARRAYATVLSTQHASAGYVKEGPYYPSHKMETELFRRTLKVAGLTAKDIQYVESHGTGTKVGDPMEIKSLETVFCPSKENPLYVGSIKSNLGHSEAAAGQSGVVKALLAFETGLIAPQRDFQTPNADCEAVVKGTVKVVSEPLELKTPYLLVNSFGFGGSLAQTALKRNPIVYPREQEEPELPRLVLFPATTEEAVQFVFQYIEQKPDLRDEFFALINKIAFCPLKLKPFRGYALFQDGQPTVKIENAVREKKREVWYVMNGMGCQWPGMGLEMMKVKTFAESMRRSAMVLHTVGVDLFELLREDTQHLLTDRSITPAFVTIAAIQVALVDLLTKLEIRPDGIVGHSTGELICAYADGCCTAEQTILSAYWRGRSVESAGLAEGAMAAVGLTLEEAVRRCPDGVYPACHNAEDSVTISGPKEVVEKFVSELQAEDIFARVVKAYGYAFHCKHVHPASPGLRAAMNQILPDPKPRTGRWLSSSYPEDEWDREECKVAGPEYFVHNLMSMVRFSDVLKKIPADAVIVEVGPHFLLQSILKRSVGSKATYLGLMKREDKNNVGFFLESMGKLYVNGLDPKIENLYRPVKFPVPRGTPVISDLIKWDHSHSWPVPVWRKMDSSYVQPLDLRSEDKYLLDHFIDGKSLYPAAGYLFLAWQALAKKLGKSESDLSVVIEDFKIHRATILDASVVTKFNIDIFKSDGRFEILTKNSLVASGKVYEVKNEEFCEPDPVVGKESSTFVSGEDLYNELKISGYQYGPAFRSLVEVSLNGKEGFVEWNEKWIPFLDSLLLFFMFCEQKPAFLLPIGALYCKICPQHIKKFIGENAANNTVLPVNFYASTRICRTVGVEIRSLEVDSVQQYSKTDSCMFQEYKFSSYMLKHSSFSSEENQKYMISCNSLIDALQNKTHKDLNFGKFGVEKVIDFNFDDYTKESKSEHRLLSALSQLVNVDTKEVSVQKFRGISAEFVKDIGKDAMNSVLVNEFSLRFMFDIITENIFKTPSILEIENKFPVVLPAIVEAVENNARLKFKNKALVCRNEEEMDQNVLDQCNIQLHTRKDLPVVAKENSQDIVVSAICTSTREEAEQHIRLMSSAVDHKGFLLLFHKDRILPAESLLANLGGQEILVVPTPVLEELFAESELVVAGKISDDICGCLYLLRRKDEASATVTEQKIVNISKCSTWFDDLKSSVCGETKKVWVISEDCSSSGIVGMINCLRHEPGGEKIRCVFMPNKSKETRKPPDFTLDDRFYHQIIEKDLVMNVYKDGVWGSFRHSKISTELSSVEVDNSYVDIKRPGDLTSLQWLESPLNHMSYPEKDFVHIYYSSLNFRDIMYSTGKLTYRSTGGRGDSSQLGFEFSGRNSRGERVAGMTRTSALATGAVCIPDMVFEIPDAWSMEEAATVPVVYSTCYYALVVRGRLQPGESVLIHSGTGGIGLAAINIAMDMDCEIFTTVGTEEKKQYLLKNYPSIKPENIGCSRNTSFEAMVMRQTNGKGVDVVLNSLADEKFHASIRCVAEHGRFLEIGKYDLSLDNKIGLKFFLKNIAFHGILLDSVMCDPSKANGLKEVARMIIEGVKRGVVKPLPKRTVFHRDEVEKAFRYMAGGTHIGKILIKIRDEEKEKLCVPKRLRLPATPVTYFYPHKVYIIIGGLGGFGIEVCKWLLSKGARNVVVTSRYGARTPYHHFCLLRWKKMGYHVTVSTRNVAVKGDAAELLREVAAIGPVGGIFNSALVLHDSFLEKMDFEKFEAVCAPKADATRHLDALSRSLCPELDHFVCFSSISCGRGNAGQMNYGYANSVMERECELRRDAGLPGLAIQWGIIGDVGVVQRHVGDDARIAGVCAQKLKSCLDILNVSCQLKNPVVSSYVVSDSSRKSGDRGNALQQLARIFGLKDPSEFNSVRSFSEMGVDSMIGIEVKHLLDSTCDLNLTVQDIQNLKIDDVKALLEKAEAQKSASKSDGLVSTVSADLPKSFYHPRPVEPLNDVREGTPLFVIDMDSDDLRPLREFGKCFKRPAFAVVLSREAPMTDVSAIASWLLQKTREITAGEKQILAYKSSSVVALEMVSQSGGEVKKLVVLDGYSSLADTIFRHKKSHWDVFSEFVEHHIPSARQRMKEQLSRAANSDQKLRLLVDFFTKSSKEKVNRSELAEAINDHITKLEIMMEYEHKEKYGMDLLVIEDFDNLLANDVAEAKKQLAEISMGKVTIQRIRDIKKFDKESIKNIISVMELEG